VPLDVQAQTVLAKMTGTPYDREGSPRSLERYIANVYRDQGYTSRLRCTPRSGEPRQLLRMEYGFLFTSQSLPVSSTRSLRSVSIQG
jgi:hypothetical protein